MELQHIANGWLVLRGKLELALYFAIKEEADQYLKQLTVDKLRLSTVYGEGL
jgi:hypothetical protein